MITRIARLILLLGSRIRTCQFDRRSMQRVIASELSSLPRRVNVDALSRLRLLSYSPINGLNAGAPPRARQLCLPPQALRCYSGHTRPRRAPKHVQAPTFPPSHPVVIQRNWFFYPMGNTPAVNLTEGLPMKKPANILLLGCGDPRLARRHLGVCSISDLVKEYPLHTPYHVELDIQ